MATSRCLVSGTGRPWLRAGAAGGFDRGATWFLAVLTERGNRCAPTQPGCACLVRFFTSRPMGSLSLASTCVAGMLALALDLIWGYVAF